jgi:long-chain acyl-CoA synthetase
MVPPALIGAMRDQLGIGLIFNGYGLTESCGTVTMTCAGDSPETVVATVGKPMPGVELRVMDDAGRLLPFDEEGEIVVRGYNVMQGYYEDPAATAEAIDADGWLHTGDLGAIAPDGYLRITGRKKDLIITSGGKNISPSALEQLLTSDPLVDQAVVYGDAKPFPTALLVPNLDLLGAEARKLGASLAADADGFLTDPALLALVNERVARLMESVSKPERVKAVVVLSRPFTVEDDDLTPTRKVRRARILQKHRDRLDALYLRRIPADEVE